MCPAERRVSQLIRPWMKIALYQGVHCSGDIEKNLSRLAQCAQRAAAQDVRLLMTSEMFLSGYHIGADAVRDCAQAADGAMAKRIAEMAKTYELAILYGYPEYANNKLFNSVQVIDSDGTRLCNYRKTHLFGDIDREVFAPGDEATVIFELEGWRVGLLICYDLEFPENARRLALAGVDLIAVPTALMHPYEFVPRQMVATRGFENSVFVAYANCCGSEKDFDYCGLSCVVGPDGVDIVRGATNEGLLYAELDRVLLQCWRRTNTYLSDRRPALYRTNSQSEAVSDDST